MTASPAFAANPGHIITITPEPARVTVRFKGEVVADSMRALRLQEASCPAVLYIPRDDLKLERFIETSRQTKCPFKGTARYWTLTGRNGEAVTAAAATTSATSSVPSMLSVVVSPVSDRA